MKAFDLIHPTTILEATRLLAKGDGYSVRAMGGGQDLLGEMKDYIHSPEQVVDLKRIPGLDKIAFDGKKGLTLGALVTISDIERHKDIQKNFPALVEAARSVATLQIRNVGTVGGNLCQRPRCWYYRNEHIVCLKKGGFKCYAAPENAENKYNAILGGGPSYIVHPSDLAPVLMCLDAVLTIAGPDGKTRQLPISEFFTLPANSNLLRENVLLPGELVTSVFVPNSPFAARSTYLKFREKDSMDWALSSVAMATDGTAVKVVLGGVAPIPWRAPKAEAALKGKSLTDEAALTAAALGATDGAEPLAQNGYKVPLTQALVKRAAHRLAGGDRSLFASREEDENSWLA